METHILHIQNAKENSFKKRIGQLFKKFSSQKNTFLFLSGGGVVGAILLAALGLTGWVWLQGEQHILPNVSIENTAVGGLSPAEAQSKLSENVSLPEYEVRVLDSDETYATPSSSLGLRAETETALQAAKDIGHAGSIWKQFTTRWQHVMGSASTTVPLLYSYEPNALNEWTTYLEKEMFIPGEHPQAVWLGSTYRIDSGELGQKLETKVLIESLQSTAGQPTEVFAPIEATHTPLSADARIFAEQRIEAVRSLSLTLSVAENEPTRPVAPEDFFSLAEAPRWLLDGHHVLRSERNNRRLESRPTKRRF